MEEIQAVITKVDETRFVMNKLMGPNGAMHQDERMKYLQNNLNEHDKLVESIGR